MRVGGRRGSSIGRAPTVASVDSAAAKPVTAVGFDSRASHNATVIEVRAPTRSGCCTG